jgi:hypothetical protein
MIDVITMREPQSAAVAAHRAVAQLDAAAGLHPLLPARAGIHDVMLQHPDAPAIDDLQPGLKRLESWHADAGHV